MTVVGLTNISDTSLAVWWPSSDVAQILPGSLADKSEGPGFLRHSLRRTKSVARCEARPPSLE